MVAENNDRAAAALAPELAAELYGMDILQRDVEDAEHNITRFVILSREPDVPALEAGPAVTTFIFRVRNVPAALYKSLGGLATNPLCGGISRNQVRVRVFERLQLTEEHVVVRVAHRGAILDVVLVLVETNLFTQRCKPLYDGITVFVRHHAPFTYASSSMG